MNPAYLGVPLALFGPGAVALLSVHLNANSPSLSNYAIALGVFVALLGCTIVIATKGERLGWRDIGFRHSSWRSVLWALPLAAFFVL
ncbi:MAG: hypothetical protein AAF658_21810, partial [Myxococcota bacterium]